MALFKILKGNEADLPSKKTEGYMYITKDTGLIYLDVDASTRIVLNAREVVSTDGTKSVGYDDIITIDLSNATAGTAAAINADQLGGILGVKSVNNELCFTWEE